MLYWKYSAILPFPEIVHIQLKSQVMQSWYPPLPVFLREIWLKEEYFADCVLLHGQTRTPPLSICGFSQSYSEVMTKLQQYMVWTNEE